MKRRPRRMTARGAIALAIAPLALGLGCEGRPKPGDGAKNAEPPKPRSGPAIATIDLTGGAPEEDRQSFFVGPHHRSFWDLSRALDDALRDKDTKGVFVRFGGASLGLAKADEVGALLAPFRKANTQSNSQYVVYLSA